MRQFQGQRQPVRALAFAPDGRHLAATDGRSGLAIYDAAGGKLVLNIPQSRGPVNHLAFLPDGRLVAACSTDVRVYLDPAQSGGFVGFFPDQVEAPVTSLAASADGSRLFATADHLYCWRTTERLPRADWVLRAEEPTRYLAAAVSPDGGRLAVITAAEWPEIELATHDAHTGERLKVVTYTGREALAWAPDGEFLAVAAGTRLWAFDTDGCPLWHTRTGSRRVFTSLAFHPAGRLLLAGCGDGTARLYDPTSRREIRSFTWPLGRALSVAFAPDGCLAAAGGEKGQVVVWDVDE